MIILRPCKACGVVVPWYDWGQATRCLSCDADHTRLLIQKYPHLAATLAAAHESKQEQVRELQKRYLATQPRSRPPTVGGVYVVQLVERINCMKIGCSLDIHKRLRGIQASYGPCRLLLTIPHAKPRTLERALHKRFAAMRLYEGSSASELFEFTTKPKQRLFERFLAEYAACSIDPVGWAERPPGHVAEGMQGQLFA